MSGGRGAQKQGSHAGGSFGEKEGGETRDRVGKMKKSLGKEGNFHQKGIDPSTKVAGGARARKGFQKEY